MSHIILLLLCFLITTHHSLFIKENIGVDAQIIFDENLLKKIPESNEKPIYSINGGSDAKKGQFKYQISLQAYDEIFCGGSILSERFVIKAAHCVVEKDGTFVTHPVKVVAGFSDVDDKYKVSVDVIEAYVPKEYDPTDKTNRSTGDLAVLKLNKDLGIKDNWLLDNVILPSKNESYDMVNATVSGFGYNSIEVVTNPKTGIREETNELFFGKLRYATANVIKLEDCQKYFVKKVTDKHLCAALQQKKKDMPEGLCSGDSGSPLVYKKIQIGVVSFSPFGCREDSQPAVYTRVSSYIDFINKVVDGTTDDSVRSSALKIDLS